MQKVSKPLLMFKLEWVAHLLKINTFWHKPVHATVSKLAFKHSITQTFVVHEHIVFILFK